MAFVVDMIVSVLAPYVGQTQADTFVRATALGLGKTSDDLGAQDMPSIENNVRRLLKPVAPAATIDGIVTEIERSIA